MDVRIMRRMRGLVAATVCLGGREEENDEEEEEEEEDVNCSPRRASTMRGRT